MSFNKYQWVRECEEEVMRQLKDGNITQEEESWDIVFNMIQDATTYNYDCFEIIKELNYTNFEDAIFDCKDIYGLAYNALYEFSLENVNVDNMIRNVQ
jgi:hypothetical protein